MKTAMISSTSLDLSEHRDQVLKACLREEVLPIGMEQHPVRDANALQTDREMVDKADAYIVILAHRYGCVPEGHEKSYTELEFDRAVERGIPILVFTIHKDHPITFDMVETGDVPQTRLAALKARACNGRIRGEFKSPDDLRGLVVQTLADLKRRQEAATAEKPAHIIHRLSHIPQAPKPYVAHPYVLLDVANVIGRGDELKLLSDWITKNDHVPKDTRIFCVVAIGGMGKSALTWKWFEDIAPNELPNIAGRMWWSFYESDAHYENFLIRALAYTAGMSEAEVRLFPSSEREDRLLRLLDERPFLLVLDGLERLLLAYARMDAAQMPDDDLDQQTANAIAGNKTGTGPVY